MKKRRYRAQKCKDVDWAKLTERCVGNTVILAIDVAKTDFVATLMLDHREILTRVKWNHPDETPLWFSGLEQLAAVTRVEAVMEPSGTYGDALRWQLNKRGIAVYKANPKRVHDGAEVYDGVPSLHDAKAADIIAYQHQDHCDERWREPTPEQRAMQSLVIRLQISKQQQQADLNRFGALLTRHWPESLTYLGQNSITLHRLIAAFGEPSAIAIDKPAARQLMRKVGRAYLASGKVEGLLKSAANTLGQPCIQEEAITLQWLAQRLIAGAHQVKSIEQQIEQQVEESALLNLMGEVVGKITSAVLLAAQGDPRHYPNASSYCKGMGLNLKERSSGTHKGQLSLTKRGAPVVRLYLYFAALRFIAKEPLVKRWYQAKTQRPGAVKMKTIVELMRKLAKGLWHTAQGEPFQVDKLFNLKVVETI